MDKQRPFGKMRMFLAGFLSAIGLLAIMGAGPAEGPGGGFVYPLVSFLVMFVIFLLLREVWCWYWKLNRIVDLLTDIRNQLGK
ncbi:hypothetical protein EP232_00590 [bacterium]|nr:MAG: hypothetical protein EP232_00590 [bacterium]